LRKNWILQPIDEATLKRFTTDLEVPPLIARLLIQRGNASVSQAHDFLCADLSSLDSPERMKDLSRAVALIRKAVQTKKKVLIVGDYDVDGLTSSALLYRVMREMGADVEVHIPHRMDDGYGLKREVVQQASRSGVALLVTVDCGSTAFEELKLAGELGIETVVVDHHDLEKGMRPAASALLNPLQPDCSYPNKGLASVGVAFTLARGLLGPAASVFEHLDLVALGTVADVAPLVGENRILVKAGLHALSGTRKVGLKALLSHRKLKQEMLTPEDVSFSLAPTLNAAGRLGSAMGAFRLLVTNDPSEAVDGVETMSRQNKNRSSLQREAFKRALSKVMREINFSRDRVIVLEDERWHLGIVGILATRLAVRFHRPAVVIALGESVGRGSARSIRSFHLLEALEAVKEHLIEFGGHPAAAGLTIAKDRIGSFREAINRFAHERMDPATLTPSVELDGELPLSELTDRLMRDLEALAPFGTGNPRPIFLSEDARFPENRRSPAFDPLGVRVMVESAAGRSFEALQPREAMAGAWNLRKIRGNVKLAYSPIRTQKLGPEITLRLSDLKLRP